MKFTARVSSQSLVSPLRLVGASAILTCVTLPASAGGGCNGDEEMPDELVVTGVVRDFREHTEEGGQADMGKRPSHGFGRYSGNMAPIIGPDRKPIFTGTGHKVTEQWRDWAHRQICHMLYDPSRGDVEGGFAQASTGGITSAETFAQWYDDVPGINMSGALSLTLVRQDNGHYVFDDELDPEYVSRGGFFPVDDRYFGNTPGEEHNFHFTFELHMEFEYDSDCDQFFMFTGDDDVWVFINDRCVIDLGGVHAAHDQYVDMDRLNLVDGEVYTVDFFFAERFQPQANFRIETNIPVRVAGLPPLTAAFD